MENTVEEPLRSAFREVMAGVAAPVSVVTSIAGGMPHGTTVSAFASLSVDPPMVLVALDQNSQLLEVITESKRFGLNVLSAAQQSIAATFAKKGAAKNVSDVIAWELDHDIPRLAGTSGWLACEVVNLVKGGDHFIVLGMVVAAETTEALPLIYHRRQYGTRIALELSEFGLNSHGTQVSAESGVMA
jgi:flavin reductase (DIM6/NTAB) family NADH-FMN oxidoreductase RutF